MNQNGVISAGAAFTLILSERRETRLTLELGDRWQSRTRPVKHVKAILLAESYRAGVRVRTEAVLCAVDRCTLLARHGHDMTWVFQWDSGEKT